MFNDPSGSLRYIESENEKMVPAMQRDTKTRGKCWMISDRNPAYRNLITDPISIQFSARVHWTGSSGIGSAAHAPAFRAFIPSALNVFACVQSPRVN